MRFERLDLNLLVALDALLSERSVSLAADRICLSQSATSSALGRLREYFEDDLLLLRGRNMILTPRGEELIEPVQAVLEQIRTTIAAVPPFNPLESDRKISIAASDYVTEMLLSEAMLEFEKTAPNMSFEICPIADQIVETLERGHTDILITIEEAVSDKHPSSVLFKDDYVVVGWSENEALEAPLTKEKYFEMDHVMVRFGQSRQPSFVESFLDDDISQRKGQIIAPSFISVAGFLIGSQRIATMHRRLATRLSRLLPLKIMPVPFEIPSVRLVAQWAEYNKADKAIGWVVDNLKKISAKQTIVRLVDDTKPQDVIGMPYRRNSATASIIRPGVYGRVRGASLN